MRGAFRWVVPVVLLAVLGCRSEPGITRVVVVTWDTTRADRLGPYGYDENTTPNLDRLAAQAVVFEQAVSQVPTTLPSHSTMFTGLYPQDHGVRYNLVYKLDDSAETLAEILHRRGFKTAGFPAAAVLHRDYGLAQGFEHWDELDVDDEDVQRFRMSAGGTRRAGAGVDAALRWLGEHGGQKTFLWLHFYDPHTPYRAPFPYSSEYPNHPYDAEIAYADAQFGRLLDALQADPAWDETLLVVAGDHGEGLQRHRETWHSYLVYESTQRVPLIVHAPGFAPRRVASPVALADLTPTVLDLVGAEPLRNIRGVSLRPALQGRALPDRFLYFETRAGALNYGWQELRGVRFRNWKLIDSSLPELFDLEADPDEEDNLAAAEPERVERFRAELLVVAEPIREETTASKTDRHLTPEQEAAFLALGYVAGAGGGSAVEDARRPQDMIDAEGEMAVIGSAIRRGDWPRVQSLCEYILGRDPANKWALTNTSLASMNLGRPEDAIAPSKRLVELYPQNPNSYSTHGRALSEAGRADEAYELLLVARDTIEDSEAVNYFLLVAAFDAEKPVCDGLIDTVLGEFPASARTYVMKSRCDLRGEGGVDAAIQTLITAVRLGYKRIELLERFDEFEELVADARFQLLIGLQDPDNSGVRAVPGTLKGP